MPCCWWTQFNSNLGAKQWVTRYKIFIYKILYIYIEKHQRNGFDLIIPDIDESDEGEYRCIATATVKNETKSPEYVLEATLTHYLKKVTSHIFDEGSGLSDDAATQTEDPNYKLLSEA